MLLAGIVGQEDVMETVSLINSILSAKGKRISVADSAGLTVNDVRILRNYMRELEKNRTDMLLLKLNVGSLDKLLYNGIYFDIMIFTGNTDITCSADSCEKDGFFDISQKLQGFMGDKGITIVNVDDKKLISTLEGKLQHVVTYGFNSKASITTSSTMDNLLDGSFMLCLQKSIPARNGLVMEPQEYKLKLAPDEYEAHNILAAVSFAIVNGIDPNNFGYT